ncbi:MAG TPA: GyrI-like domain-containing protein [Methylocystis sp.]|nr:GyrI-like domain-containing protein [Methylocystis sp.]
MQVDIIEIAPMRLHTILHSGPVSDIPQAWRRLEEWLSARGLRDQVELVVGLCEEAPNDVGDIVYRAGVVLRGAVAASDEIEIVGAPGGRYAGYRHVGPYSEIADAFQRLYREWLPTSGFEPDNRPALDICRNDPRVTPEPELVTDLLLPIR